MNNISFRPIEELGKGFIPSEFLPTGKDENYLRDEQFNELFPNKKFYPLTPQQIDILVQHGNKSDNWNNILISEGFDPYQVKNCKFFGKIRIGALPPAYREFHDLRLPVGLYNSTIINSDIGNNVCIDTVHYLTNYIIGDDVMISNINELATTNHAKFGNGILKDGEDERTRVKLEVCNENAGRAIIPFNGMLPGDAYLWSRSRQDHELQNKFTAFTEKKFDTRHGYFGTIGARTILKNSRIIKDCKIGSDAYIKGANKIKNVTINSDAERKSQIGEGCELVNGIVGYGCRIFYGVKAVRFVLSSHSQLKYGARLINSYLGNNSTISCCEVLNSLIFPSHEQHHNNSFLCAALIMGQSNIAAGATLGSNHNSRAADGELIAERGFWPALSVSLKHNSKFASFTLLARGDYGAELNIPIPFALVSLDPVNDQVVVNPGYWFANNMYALERNAWKYRNRDMRTGKLQKIEYDYLAPDSINEVFNALTIFNNVTVEENGSALVKGWENSKKTVKLLKIEKSKEIFNKLVEVYAGCQLLHFLNNNNFKDFDSFLKALPADTKRTSWMNVGGQLIRTEAIDELKENIKSGKISDWDAVHDFYREQGARYDIDKLQHAFASFLEIKNICKTEFTIDTFHELLDNTLSIKEWMARGIYQSRAKDYENPFRKMVYENDAEMNEVIGTLESNTFIQQENQKIEQLKFLVSKAKQLR